VQFISTTKGSDGLKGIQVSPYFPPLPIKSGHSTHVIRFIKIEWRAINCSMVATYRYIEPKLGIWYQGTGSYRTADYIACLGSVQPIKPITACWRGKAVIGEQALGFTLKIRLIVKHRTSSKASAPPLLHEKKKKEKRKGKKREGRGIFMIPGHPTVPYKTIGYMQQIERVWGNKLWSIFNRYFILYVANEVYRNWFTGCPRRFYFVCNWRFNLPVLNLH